MPHITAQQAKAVVEQAISNLKLHHKNEFSKNEMEQIRAELETIVLAHGDLAGFVGDNPDECQLEFLAANLSEQEFNHAMARNLFRYLLHISDACVNPGDTVFRSPLLQRKMLASIFSQRDPKLFTAARHEMQKMLDNILRRLKHHDLTLEQEKSYKLFLDLVLSIYPFIDPVANESIFYPTKAPDGAWVRQEYVIRKINISPHTGLLSYLLEEEDFIHALGLEPVHNNINASSIGLIMGTTYPAGQGFRLANIYNFYPHLSVGEGHDFTDFDAWVERQNSVIIKGHSKGATVSMIETAKHPTKIKQADCFNPAPLTSSTLARLSPAWNALAQKPKMNVYLQDGDPIGFLGRGYLKDSNIIRIIPGDAPERKVSHKGKWFLSIALIKFVDACNLFFRNMAQFYERHVLYHVGRSGTLAIRGNVDELNQSKGREFFGKMKSVLNFPIFAFYYVNFVAALCLRRVERLYYNNLASFRIIIAALTFLAMFALLGAGLLFPPAAALVALLPFGWAAIMSPYIGAVTAAMMVVGIVIAPFVLELATTLANALIGLAVGLTQFAIVLTTGLLSAIPVAFSLIEASKKEEIDDKVKSTHRLVNKELHETKETQPLVSVVDHAEEKIPKKEAIRQLEGFFTTRHQVNNVSDNLFSSPEALNPPRMDA